MLAGAEDATRFEVVLSAAMVLFHRTGSQVDLVVGVGTGGCVLPLRADLSGRPGFRALLARVRGAAGRFSWAGG